MFTLNTQRQDVSEDWANKPLLYLLRERFGLKGAKFGCVVGQCGACTVITGGEAPRSCTFPARALTGSDVRTIEELARGTALHPVKRARLAEAVRNAAIARQVRS